jgi:hypothetical protein
VRVAGSITGETRALLEGPGAVPDVIFADHLFLADEPESVVDKLTRFLVRPSAGC